MFPNLTADIKRYIRTPDDKQNVYLLFEQGIWALIAYRFGRWARTISPEVAGDAALLVDPRNIGEISAAMDQVCGDARLRQSFIAKGFKRAKLFSWDKFAGQMRAVYSLA